MLGLSGEVWRVWWKVAFLSFGGPAAQIAVMQRLIVEEKGWIGQDRFNHALNFCMLLPGPEAQQLATYIGWLLHGTRGALAAGIIFILPGALIMLGLSLLYVTVGQVGVVEGLLFGLKCAVLAIVAQALVRMSGKVVRGLAAGLLALASFTAMFLFSLPFPLVILAAGVIGMWLFRPGAAPEVESDTSPRMGRHTWLWTLLAWLGPLAVLAVVLGPGSVWTELATLFSLLATFSFGGAYAVLAWVAQFASETRDWLTAAEMLDGLGLAETTPGPLILVTQFIGFLAASRNPATLLDPLLAGSLGALLTTWMVFAPSFLWIFLFAPKVEKLRGNARISAALRGITSAVVGVIANLAAWFAINLMFAESRPVDRYGLDFNLPVATSIDPWALVLTALAAVLLFLTRLGLVGTILCMALVGLVLHLVGAL
ncbi:chromate efflux transporter [Wenzhouxiangella sp. AB-CW3]|uniref:chromate efflux transporter n=1 Tax=Wenzhouxiangella sp. AB-CW3 TaxID=2771012 RepID=UPI00168BF7DA|nr:chromate efflux transporter [Wenzhouxiangella sp. AB-CW3]QOC21671.1 chromate efflux transporter [Wenzhouxiangella sp. AB-CW3]